MEKGIRAPGRTAGRMSLGEDYVIVQEGAARILAPNPDRYRRSDGVYEPAWAPVFYNPRMVFNRDLAVLLASTMLGEGWVFAEPLAGTGVRGIRLLLEAGAEKGVLNDADPRACRLTARNILANKLGGRATIYCMDASQLLLAISQLGVRFDYIDIDPFGSPMPFLDAALRSARRGAVLAVTATDTAPLSGTHPASCLRRYQATPLREGPSRETALRILVGAVVRRAAEHDVAAEVLLAYFADYYLRAYFRLRRGARKAREALDKIGYLECLDKLCLSTRLVDGYPIPRGITGKAAGPLWTGRLCIEELVERLEERLGEKHRLRSAERIRVLLGRLREECSINKPYIRVDRLSGFLRVSMPSPRLLASRLVEKGFKATVSSFDPRAIATDASLEEVKTAIIELVRSR